MMALSFYLGCLIFAIVFLRFLFSFAYGNGLPIYWPFVGMTPTMVLNLHRAHNTIFHVLKRCNGTVQYKGVWFTNTNFLATCDPHNVQYILSTNNAAYVKDSEWMKVFDIFGESLFNSSGEEWKRHRKVFHAFLNHPQFHQSLPNILHNRLEQGLVKVMDFVSKQGIMVNLQDLFLRYAFDIGCIMATGYNPGMLSVEFPENRFSKAMSDIMVAGIYRFLSPDNLWKLQSWLQIGMEKRRNDAWKTMENNLAKYIIEKSNNDEEIHFSLLNCYLTGHNVTGLTPSDNIIRDNVLFFLLASIDTYSLTLTWFFFFLSKNPSVETKIREELNKHLSMKVVGGSQCPSWFNELSKLTYLHAALCETLRLSPPIPFEFRTCNEQDILPSGHRVDKNMRVVIAIQAMGTMGEVWGEDCDDFKPERWITKDGKIKREAPNKFLAFLAGPRICPGKDLSFFLMKATAATIIHNYNVHVIQGQKIAPIMSVLYQMKKGLLVRINSREK